MATQSTTDNTRPSTETDRRHLLAPSATPSRATSILDSGQTTPRASSPSRTEGALPQARRGTIADPTPQPYKGFPSEAHYLAALREWAEEKKYIQSDNTLIGFYGKTTMQEYASRPKMQLGLSRRLRERKERKEARRNSAV